MEQIHQISCGNVNCFIISNGETGILIDTGREKYKQKVLNACKQLNMRLLILTHGHVDHIQNAAFLSNTLNIPIAMSKLDLDLISDNTRQPLSSHGILGKVVLSASLKSFKTDKIDPFIPDVYLENGDTLNEYGINVNIISLSGHTKGSIGIDVAGHSIIAGDALMNLFYPAVSMLYNDKHALLQSAQKISALGERKIYFGHGKPLDNRKWV